MRHTELDTGIAGENPVLVAYLIKLLSPWINDTPPGTIRGDILVIEQLASG